MYLVLAVVWGLIFPPRDWCKYVCVLGAYAQLYGRIRVLGIRVDKDVCRKCKPCLCQEKCLIDVDWTEITQGEKWLTPDYCIVCCNCINTCPFGAVYAWRVH